MKKAGKNKGAAMISVLIAITFIGILSTSLLYMAYANYMTKVVRYNSQDNFYSAEFGLDELSASLKQVAYMETDSDDAMDALVNAIDPNHNGKFSDNGTSIVSNLMKTSSQDADFEISYDPNINPAVSAEYEADYSNAKLTIYGIKIVANGKSGTVRDGYKSNVALNLEIKFPFNAKKNSPALSDFSLISDAPYSAPAGGDTFFTGCVYLQGVGKNGSSSMDSPTPAIVVKDGMTCFQGYQNIINGDVVVEKGGVLNVTGDLLVSGYIDVKSGGALICSGKVQTQYGIKTSGSNSSYISKGISCAPDTSLSWNNLPDNSIKGGTIGTGGGVVLTPAKYRAYKDQGGGNYVYADFFEGEAPWQYESRYAPIPSTGFPATSEGPALDYAQAIAKCSTAYGGNTELIEQVSENATPEVGGSHGLANLLFAKYVVVMDTSGNPMCIQIRKITDGTALKYSTPADYVMSGGTGHLMINGDGGVYQAPGDSIRDCLVFNLCGQARLKGTFINSMFLSETPIERDTRQLPVYMQKMDEDVYQSMLESYWIKGPASFNNGQLPKTKYVELHGDSGTDCSGQSFNLTTVVQDPRGSVYGGSTAVQKTYVIKTVDENGNVKTSHRNFEYLADGSYTNLIQLKNFLADDPNAAINLVFGSVYSAAVDTVPANKKSVVTYDKWFKNKD